MLYSNKDFNITEKKLSYGGNVKCITLGEGRKQMIIPVGEGVSLIKQGYNEHLTINTTRKFNPRIDLLVDETDNIFRYNYLLLMGDIKTVAGDSIKIKTRGQGSLVLVPKGSRKIIKVDEKYLVVSNYNIREFASLKELNKYFFGGDMVMITDKMFELPCSVDDLSKFFVIVNNTTHTEDEEYIHFNSLDTHIIKDFLDTKVSEGKKSIKKSELLELKKIMMVLNMLKRYQ